MHGFFATVLLSAKVRCCLWVFEEPQAASVSEASASREIILRASSAKTLNDQRVEELYFFISSRKISKTTDWLDKKTCVILAPCRIFFEQVLGVNNSLLQHARAYFLYGVRRKSLQAGRLEKFSKIRLNRKADFSPVLLISHWEIRVFAREWGVDGKEEKKANARRRFIC